MKTITIENKNYLTAMNIAEELNYTIKRIEEVLVENDVPYIKISTVKLFELDKCEPFINFWKMKKSIKA